MTRPAKTSITSTVLLPRADTNNLLRFTSAVKWSSRPATLGTGICSSSCKGSISRAVVWATTIFELRPARSPTAKRTNPPTTSNFFIAPPQVFSFPSSTGYLECTSRLRFKYQNRSFFVIVGGCSDVIAIQLRRPKRSAGTGFRDYRPDGFVVIRIFLLIHENVPDVIVAAPGNVDSSKRSIEIDAVHAFHGWEICDLLAGLRVQGNHLRRRSCADKKPVVFFVKGSVTIPLTADRPRGHHFAFLRIDDLNLACGRNEDEQGFSRLV